MKSKTDIRTLSEKELNARLVRDLTEVCPAGEREALAAWRAADPAPEEEYARIRSYWNARVTTTRSIDPEREFRKLQRRIAAGSESRRSGMQHLLASRMGRYASMAAMLAVGLFCGWALSGPRAAERFAFITGSSISSFELPDGSRITLDKESRLEYDGDFGRDERNVRLVGKGFFEVEKMPDKRFVVEMGDVQVSVLGTTFDASNRTEEGIVSASLVEGSVAFRAGNQNLRLTPSRRAVYHVGSGEITVSEFDPEITTAWKDNLFRYKSLTLEEVLEQLSARYDVRIITDAGDVGRTRFSGALETRLSVEQALDIVSRQTGMEWSKLDNVYFVTKR